MIRLYLDRPPSLNNLFPGKATGGRGISAEYAEWRRRQQANMMAQRPIPMQFQVNIKITIADEGNGDADNFLKAPIDLLVHHGLIKGDNRLIVRNVSCGWGWPIWDLHPPRPMGCMIEVTPA